ncbi:MAG: hypothetical protein IJ463_06340 [Bacilli bacterium]|nr:hypothetical protein [Bacilli bacterium]
MENELICKCCKKKISSEIKTCPFCGNIVEDNNTSINTNYNVSTEPIKNKKDNRKKETKIEKAIFFILGLLSLIGAIIATLILGSNILDILILSNEGVIVTNIISALIVLLSFAFGFISCIDGKNKIGTIGMILSIIPLILVALAIYKPFYIENKYKSLEPKKENKPIIKEMVNHLNNKYNINITENDCIQFKIEDYRQKSYITYTANRNVPNVGVFEIDNKKIKVIENNGNMIDNYQIEEINDLIAEYFSKILSVKVDYVEIREQNDQSIKNYLLNGIIVNKMNTKITKNNIEELINEIYKIPNLKLVFYIKDTENRNETINKITNNSIFLREENIKEFNVYIYSKDEDLSIIYLDEKLNKNLDYENYKEIVFGSYFVPNEYEYDYEKSYNQEYDHYKSNTFVASIKHKYNSKNTNEEENNWKIDTYDEQ